MKMVNKSLYQILEGQEVLLNSAISSLDLNGTSNLTVKPMLEYLRQDIKAHLRDLQGASSTTVTQEDSKNVEVAQWVRIDQLDQRVSKLENIVLPKKRIFNEQEV